MYRVFIVWSNNNISKHYPTPTHSASIPLSRRSCRDTSQSRPTCWYSRRDSFLDSTKGLST